VRGARVAPRDARNRLRGRPLAARWAGAGRPRGSRGL